jgi:uncharacterized protein YcbX
MRSVARFCVSPVKGMALQHPTAVELGANGVVGDRRFYLVDDLGELYSATDYERLVQVRPTYDAGEERLRLAFPDGAIAEGDASDLGEPAVTNFYGRPVPAHVVRGPFGESVSDLVGRRLRLLRSDREGDASDVEPLTLVSEASVADLATRGRRREPLDPGRFRMNIEVAGCRPYDEDSWDGGDVRIGEAVVRVSGQVPRCVITTLSPHTGQKDWDTLTQIAKFRARIPGDGGLPFGVYARVRAPGKAAIGDEVVPTA